MSDSFMVTTFDTDSSDEEEEEEEGDTLASDTSSEGSSAVPQVFVAPPTPVVNQAANALQPTDAKAGAAPPPSYGSGEGDAKERLQKARSESASATDSSAPATPEVCGQVPQEVVSSDPLDGPRAGTPVELKGPRRATIMAAAFRRKSAGALAMLPMVRKMKA